jgi:mRNA interferase MazF
MDLIVKQFDIVLCKFYFTDLKKYKNRPVLIFKENLPFDDLLVIAISSKTNQLFADEIVIDNKSLASGELPKISKIMLRKTFVIERNIILKKYGSLTTNAISNIKKEFCSFYNC